MSGATAVIIISSRQQHERELAARKAKQENISETSLPAPTPQTTTTVLELSAILNDLSVFLFKLTSYI
jgi:hypothetical protein